MNETSPDADSQPSSAATNCTPTQDDEAVWTINLGQSGQAVSPLSNENQGTETADFTIFPNPTDGFCTIDLSRVFEEKVAISVSGIFGKTALVEKIDVLKTPTVDLDLSREMAGVHFIKVEADGLQPVVKRLIINRL